MKIALIGSGSGGHINPCIAFYRYARVKNVTCYPFLFRKIDEEFYKLQQINGIKINSQSFYKVYKELCHHFKDLKIDCLITFGGKVSFIAILAAKKCNIPIYMCEQNIVFGKANQLGKWFARKIFLSLPIKETDKYIYTGNPVVENLQTNEVKLFNNLKPKILVVCGSLGSSTVMEKIKAYANNHANYNFIIIKGKKATIAFKEQANIKVFDYYEPLRNLIASCDVMISRAGATTISEIIALAKPSILIPSPYVTNNHQYKNAMFLKKRAACLMIEEKDLNEDSLELNIKNLLNQRYQMYQIHKKLTELQVQHPCQKMLQVIKEDLYG